MDHTAFPLPIPSLTRPGLSGGGEWGRGHGEPIWTIPISPWLGLVQQDRDGGGAVVGIPHNVNARSFLFNWVIIVRLHRKGYTYSNFRYILKLHYAFGPSKHLHQRYLDQNSLQIWIRQYLKSPPPRKIDISAFGHFLRGYEKHVFFEREINDCKSNIWFQCAIRILLVMPKSKFLEWFLTAMELNWN